MRTPADRDTEQRNPEHVRSLVRGLAVIRAFGPERPELSLSEVARATGLSRAAARRFLLTLAELGYVRADDGKFALRPRVLELGYAYLSSLTLTEVAQPHMEALVARVNESSSIAVLDDLDVVYVVRVPTRRIMSITIAVGTRLPAYATSMGRVLLAGLPDGDLDERLQRTRLEPLTPRTQTDPAAFRAQLRSVRRQGFATVDQELEEGVRSVAVPIEDPRNGAGAALNVSAHATRASMQALRRVVLPQLRETATAIEAELRSVTGPPTRREVRA